jgi:hypothetical protein
MLEVLERIGRESNLTVYVQANNQDGRSNDIDLIGAETGRSPDLIEFFGELGDECFSYNARYRPRNGADVLFIRPPGTRAADQHDASARALTIGRPMATDRKKKSARSKDAYWKPSLSKSNC